MKSDYDMIKKLFELYNTTNLTRDGFVDKAVYEFFGLTASEASLIWKSLDYAYEQWAIDPHSGDE